MVRTALQVGAMTLASASVSPPQLDGCVGVAIGTAWRPSLNAATNEMDWHQCQVRCSVTPACAHFSYLRDGTCHLQALSARNLSEADAVSGPPTCGAPPEYWSPPRAPSVPRSSVAQPNGLSTVTAVLSPASRAGDIPAAPQLGPPAMLPEAHAEAAGRGASPTAPTAPPSGPPGAPASSSLRAQRGQALAGPAARPTEAEGAAGVGSWWRGCVALLIAGGAIYALLWLAWRCHNDGDSAGFDDEGETRRSRLEAKDRTHRSVAIEPEILYPVDVVRGAQLEKEVIYPQTEQVRWHPTILRHPSVIGELSSNGWQASVSGFVNASRDDAATQRTASAGTAYSRVGSATPRAGNCKVGDTVEVFSKGAGTWLRCRVAKIEGRRMTVTHGDMTRRINLEAEDLHEHFRLLTHEVVL